jgi:hypothetical protein
MPLFDILAELETEIFFDNGCAVEGDLVGSFLDTIEF